MEVMVMAAEVKVETLSYMANKAVKPGKWVLKVKQESKEGLEGESEVEEVVLGTDPEMREK